MLCRVCQDRISITNKMAAGSSMPVLWLPRKAPSVPQDWSVAYRYDRRELLSLHEFAKREPIAICGML